MFSLVSILLLVEDGVDRLNLIQFLALDVIDSKLASGIRLGRDSVSFLSLIRFLFTLACFGTCWVLVGAAAPLGAVAAAAEVAAICPSWGPAVGS